MGESKLWANFLSVNQRPKRIFFGRTREGANRGFLVNLLGGGGRGRLLEV
jgi:hypothetical protein